MSISALNYETRMEYYCGYDVFVQRGWTHQNPGRRFVACPDYDAHSNIRSCNFFSLGWQRNDWVAEGGDTASDGGKIKNAKGSRGIEEEAGAS